MITTDAKDIARRRIALRLEEIGAWKRALDAYYGDGTVESKEHFEGMRVVLKEKKGGVRRVIGALEYRRRETSGSRREKIDTELGYFRRNQKRMQYSSYLTESLPIASGVVEATCKTLVTQRLKHSGMQWSPRGGQAILTLRSLAQSGRWETGWGLLAASFHKDCRPRPALRLIRRKAA
jgi:hypothetical protein